MRFSTTVLEWTMSIRKCAFTFSEFNGCCRSVKYVRATITRDGIVFAIAIAGVIGVCGQSEFRLQN